MTCFAPFTRLHPQFLAVPRTRAGFFHKKIHDTLCVKKDHASRFFALFFLLSAPDRWPV
jgi:hypothetical protein